MRQFYRDSQRAVRAGHAGQETCASRYNSACARTPRVALRHGSRRHHCARPGRPRRRARRRQGRVRRGRADRRARRDRSLSRSKPSYDQARVAALQTREPFARRRRAARISASAAAAACSISMHAAQVAVKQRVLEDALWHIGRVRPQMMLAPIHGLDVGLPPARAAVGAPRAQERRRAGRLSREEIELRRRHDELRGAARAHLRAAAGTARADRRDCRSTTACRRSSWRCGESDAGTGRRDGAAHPRSRCRPSDERDLLAFAAPASASSSGCSPQGPATVRPFGAARRNCRTRCPISTSRFAFEPTDFTQVNAEINRVLVRRAIGLLDPRPGERIADFFCGLGNFTLPIARRGAQVLGVEGNAALVRRAEANAAAQRPRRARPLRRPPTCSRRRPRVIAALGHARQGADRPAARRRDRAGQGAGRERGIARIVYVSCNPATLARDAAVLVNQNAATSLRAAGIANMFPHTAHVESIALFERGPRCRRGAKKRAPMRAPFIEPMPFAVSRADRRRSAAGSGC